MADCIRERITEVERDARKKSYFNTHPRWLTRIGTSRFSITYKQDNRTLEKGGHTMIRPDEWYLVDNYVLSNILVAHGQVVSVSFNWNRATGMTLGVYVLTEEMNESNFFGFELSPIETINVINIDYDINYLPFDRTIHKEEIMGDLSLEVNRQNATMWLKNDGILIAKSFDVPALSDPNNKFVIASKDQPYPSRLTLNAVDTTLDWRVQILWIWKSGKMNRLSQDLLKQLLKF